MERCIQHGRAVFPESFKQTGTENRKKHLHCFESERDTGFDTLSEQAFIFYGKTPDRPLCRSQAYRIIKNACHQLRLPDNIGCHSLRKIFGYQALQAGVNPAILMLIYNHSSFQVTKRYLGIDQDDKDNIFLEINL